MPKLFHRALIMGESAAALSLALCFSQSGFSTTLIDEDEASRDRSRYFLDKLCSDRPDYKVEYCDFLDFAIKSDAVERHDLVVEAGAGSADERADRLREFSRFIAGDATILINTTNPDLSCFSQVTEKSQTISAVHFLSPAHRAGLVEIINQPDEKELPLSIERLAGYLSKQSVFVKPVEGLVANRLSVRFYEAADTLLMDGALPYEIDEALVEFGFSIGPYEAQDLSGLDGPYYERKTSRNERDPQRRYIPISDRMVEEGRLGKKVGVGWYRYPGGGGAVIDPLIEDLISEEAHFARVERREVEPSEIITTLMNALINEAAAILTAGIVKQAEDIDLIARHALSIQPEIGGPCHYADKLGLKDILEQLHELEKQDTLWRPSEFLIKSVAQGTGFYEAGKIKRS